jgi:hypothetical protein
MWKSVDAIREIRNRFTHRINRDIPDDVKKMISEMVSLAVEDEKAITDDFVDMALMKLAKLVKTIELAYIEFYEKTKNG